MAKAPPTVDLYIAQRAPDVRAVLEALRALVGHALPGAVEQMKWGAPVWSVDGAPQVYLYGGKEHAHLGFVHGAALHDPEGLLRGKGAEGRHVKIIPGRAIATDALKALLCQCGPQHDAT